MALALALFSTLRDNMKHVLRENPQLMQFLQEI
jgi:hypothetical protein